MFFWMFGGFILGYLFFGFWGAIIGTLIGGLATSRRKTRQEGINENSSIFLHVTFMVMGHIAKADGRVSREEITEALFVQTSFKLGPKERGAAIQDFNFGKSSSFNLEKELTRLAEFCGHDQTLMEVFFDAQVRMAYADGKYTAAEEEIIESACALLGFPLWKFHYIRDSYLGSRQDAGSQSTSDHPKSQDTDWAYKTLNVSSSDSIETIKKAHARLLREFHPDKLAAKGLPKEMMDFATDKTKDLTRAYDVLRKHHQAGT